MKVLERATMPNGVKIQLEDWSENNTKEHPTLFGLTIGAYPTAKREFRHTWGRPPAEFRLTIAMSSHWGYSDENVRSDYEALKNGAKTLEDLSDHFHNGDKDKWRLGMDVKYQGW